MIRTLLRQGAGERGATAIEYALIASLISIVIVGAATAVGVHLTAVFNKIAALMP